VELSEESATVGSVIVVVSVVDGSVVTSLVEDSLLVAVGAVVVAGSVRLVGAVVAVSGDVDGQAGSHGRTNASPIRREVFIITRLSPPHSRMQAVMRVYCPSSMFARLSKRGRCPRRRSRPGRRSTNGVHRLPAAA